MRIVAHSTGSFASILPGSHTTCVSVCPNVFLYSQERALSLSPSPALVLHLPSHTVLLLRVHPARPPIRTPHRAEGRRCTRCHQRCHPKSERCVRQGSRVIAGQHACTMRAHARCRIAASRARCVHGDSKLERHTSGGWGAAGVGRPGTHQPPQPVLFSTTLV